MENEEFLNKKNRYIDSDFYKELKTINDTDPRCIDLYFPSLVKVTYASNEDELLETICILTSFILTYENLRAEMKAKTIDTTVREILPILDKRDSENVRTLVSNKYNVVLQNFEEIKDTSDDPGIASKCTSAIDRLTFKEEL